MSAFPRKIAKRIPRVTTTFNRIFTGTIMASPVVAFCGGEYLGWWKNLDPPEPGSTEASYMEMKREDFKASKVYNYSLGMFTTSTFVTRNTTKDMQIDTMPTGYKEYIRDPENKDVKVKTSDTWNYQNIDEHRALAFTSSKPQESQKPSQEENKPPTNQKIEAKLTDKEATAS